MQVLVTGGAGFIGAHVGHALQERGDALTVVDDFNQYYDPRLKRARTEHLLRRGTPILEADVRDTEAMGTILRDVRPDAILHFAAWAGVRPSRKYPLHYTRANIEGTANLFDAAASAGITRILLASSSSVYGPHAPVPSPEDSATQAPPSVYGITKRVGEFYADFYHRVHGVQVTCLRFFTTYGSWYRPDMAIWRFTERMLRGEPIRVHVRSRDGREVRRGFTDVRDITRGVLAALDRNHPFGIINLGSADPVPLLRLIAVLEDALQVRATVVEEILPEEEEVQTAASLDRAQSLLGYAPTTSIEKGAQEFVRWYRDDFQRLFPSGIASSQYWTS